MRYFPTEIRDTGHTTNNKFLGCSCKKCEFKHDFVLCHEVSAFSY